MNIGKRSVEYRSNLGVAQWLARSDGIREVAGSSPATQTKAAVAQLVVAAD